MAKINLYNVQDVLVGFGSPFAMGNNELAIRAYKGFLTRAQNPEDMRLFRVGEMEDETGEIFPITPECIMGGGEKNEI